MKNLIFTLLFIVFSTTLFAQVPPAPELVAPLNGATGVVTNPLLDWKSAEFAYSYRVQVSKDIGFFTDIIYDSNNIMVTQFQVPVNGLLGHTQYFWRVNATNSYDSSTSFWSNEWGFFTIFPPGIPILLSPPDSSIVSSLTPLLDWNDVDSAVWYRIQVSEVPNFSPTLIDKWGGAYTQSQYQILTGILSNNVQYYWRTRARNSAGYGPWASAWNFITSEVGINPITGKIPTDFCLYSNYPNPFNPFTNIRFDIPKQGFVSLKIYDILGKEVTTLVNEKINTGRYEVDWDGSGYPSGVYIYKLHAGDFVDVKKMILLK